jgi:hypothetical protein
MPMILGKGLAERKWLPVLHTIRTERMKDIRALAMVFPNGFKASFDQAA